MELKNVTRKVDVSSKGLCIEYEIHNIDRKGSVIDFSREYLELEWNELNILKKIAQERLRAEELQVLKHLAKENAKEFTHA